MLCTQLMIYHEAQLYSYILIVYSIEFKYLFPSLLSLTLFSRITRLSYLNGGVSRGD